ncbi:MAG: hypothetical protein M5U15_14345 [Kiritimatiellae bacterium]|nr:hypothetical protein [Kiritimatiellia bacterium]
MVRETRSDESKPNYYVWGLDLSGTLQGAGGVGGLLARVRQENIPHPLYYASDANGNITDVLNTNGTLAAHYEYDPFGNIVALSGDLAGINPFRFSSKYWDAGVGVYYYGYRYYSPQIGRWLSRDLAWQYFTDAYSLDGYDFVRNYPVARIDYLGLLCDPTVWSGVATWQERGSGPPNHHYNIRVCRYALVEKGTKKCKFLCFSFTIDDEREKEVRSCYTCGTCSCPGDSYVPPASSEQCPGAGVDTNESHLDDDDSLPLSGSLTRARFSNAVSWVEDWLYASIC